MLELSKDIDSLSSFKRNTSEFLTRLKNTGDPVVLTVNGKAQVVVQDIESYRRLLELAESLDSLEFLRESLDDAANGRTVPMRRAIKALGKRK